MRSSESNLSRCGKKEQLSTEGSDTSIISSAPFACLQIVAVAFSVL